MKKPGPETIQAGPRLLRPPGRMERDIATWLVQGRLHRNACQSDYQGKRPIPRVAFRDGPRSFEPPADLLLRPAWTPHAVASSAGSASPVPPGPCTRVGPWPHPTSAGAEGQTSEDANDRSHEDHQRTKVPPSLKSSTSCMLSPGGGPDFIAWCRQSDCSLDGSQ